MSIGDKVAQLRKQRGWTLKQLANLSGISVSHISAIEHMARPNPSLTTVTNLAKAFEVPLSYFDESTSGAESAPQQIKQSGSQAPRPTATQAVAGPEETWTSEWVQALARLYDPATRQFIASEQSKPYVALAMELAKQESNADPSFLLQLIARFMRENQIHYRPS